MRESEKITKKNTQPKVVSVVGNVFIIPNSKQLSIEFVRSVQKQFLIVF